MNSTKAKTKLSILDELQVMFKEEDEGDLFAISRLFQQRLANPEVYVSVCGETSAGKSSLINGIFSRELLPVNASPNTAIVTDVVCQEADIEEYYAIYKDATQEKINRELFKQLNQDPIEDILRLQVRVMPDETGFNELRIFDTPGFNSLIEKHVEILLSFLPQSDLIIFVVGYRTGFGQIEQDLLELIRDATIDDSEIPVLLVVNRVPKNVNVSNKRIDSIVRNARDCLTVKPELLLIPSMHLRSESDLDQSSDQEVPDSRILWEVVAKYIKDPSRIQSVEQKLGLILLELIDEADSIFERKEIILRADTDKLNLIKEEIEEIRLARKHSMQEVEATISGLKLQLPVILQNEITSMKKQLSGEISRSEKWFGADDCSLWLRTHAMPFEIKRIGHTIESYIYQEMEALNQRLDEIANIAVNTINKRVRLQSMTSDKFAKNLTAQLLKRAGGNAIRNGLQKFGGACGQAAGAGNLAKMLLSKGGKVVGKTFSRSTYTRIGRFFNLKNIKWMNAAFTAVVESIVFVVEANKWKNSLIKAVSKAVDSWEKEVFINLEEEQVPQLLQANIDSVHLVYDDLINESEKILLQKKNKNDLQKVLILRSRISHFREVLAIVN